MRGCSFHLVVFWTGGDGGAADVEVGPFLVGDEFLEEGGGFGRAGSPTAGAVKVAVIGDFGIHFFDIVFVDW